MSPYASSTDLSGLPVELVAHLASFLALADLKAFRLTGHRFSQATLELLIPLKPTKMHYSVRPRANFNRDLVLMSKTPKMMDNVEELFLQIMKESVEDLLPQVSLPSLRTFRVLDNSVSAANLNALLSNHAGTLRTLSLNQVRLFATNDELSGQKTSGWSMVMDCVASRMQLTHLHILQPAYISEETGESRAVAPYPEKRCGSLFQSGCCEELDRDEGAFIDFSLADANTRDAVVRVANAFTDEKGKERFRNRDDVDIEVEGDGSFFPFD